MGFALNSCCVSCRRVPPGVNHCRLRDIETLEILCFVGGCAQESMAAGASHRGGGKQRFRRKII